MIALPGGGRSGRGPGPAAGWRTPRPSACRCPPSRPCGPPPGSCTWRACRAFTRAPRRWQPPGWRSGSARPGPANRSAYGCPAPSRSRCASGSAALSWPPRPPQSARGSPLPSSWGRSRARTTCYRSSTCLELSSATGGCGAKRPSGRPAKPATARPGGWSAKPAGTACQHTCRACATATSCMRRRPGWGRRG